MASGRWLAIACIFFAGCATGADEGLTGDDDDDASMSPTPTATPGDTYPTAPDVAQIAAPDCSNGRKVHVRYAVDGDTLDLSQIDPDTHEDERVRLVGIDTPESYPEDDPECYGPEASDETHALMDDTDACLTYDPAVTAESDNTDKYGRTLGYIFFGDGYSRFLNAELVAGGYAEDYPYTDGAVFETYFYELEVWARQQELGQWSACK